MTLTYDSMQSSPSYRAIPWPTAGTALAPSPLQVPERLQPLIDQLNELLALRKGWNSYAAPEISIDACRRALHLLIETQWDGPLPTTAPTTSGGVQLEWGGEDEGVELEFTPDNKLGVLIDADGRQREIWVDDIHHPEVFEALTWARKFA